MNASPSAVADALPSRLPHPLDDPLRFYWRLLAFLMVPFAIAVFLGTMCMPRMGGQDWGLALDQAGTILWFFLIFAIWRLLPRQVTSAIYLRSFRNDALANPIRTVTAAALGRGFRLSGIRDPRRRWPWLLRHLVYLLFLIRYCRPRFMNLEAGPDWKARLWRSLGEARCALIDVTDLTPFVLDEVQLAVQCLGAARILFVVDTTQSVAAWEEKIAAQMTVPVSTDELHLAVWEDTPQGRRSFANQVRHFAERVPEEPAGLRPEVWPLTQSQQPIEGRSGGRELMVVEFGLACLASLGIVQLNGWLVSETPSAWRLLWFVPTFGLLLLTLGFLIHYLVEAGTVRDRVVSSLLLGFPGLFAGLLLVGEWRSPPEGVRGAAARTVSSNNLRQIGVALQNYEASVQRLPPAVAFTADGKPHVSWRVLLLPYLDHEALYQQFRLGEPWDSPHNLGVAERMPRVYQAPTFHTPPEPTKTYYRVFVGPRTPLGGGAPRPGAPFRQLLTAFGENGIAQIGAFDFNRRLAGFEKASDTFLVVEAKEAVPWTKPEELGVEGFDFQDPHRALGAVSRRGFVALMADGSTRFFDRSEKRTAEEWRAMIQGERSSPQEP
jgi:hypothetical protein